MLCGIGDFAGTLGWTADGEVYIPLESHNSATTPPRNVVERRFTPWAYTAIRSKKKTYTATSTWGPCVSLIKRVMLEIWHDIFKHGKSNVFRHI